MKNKKGILLAEETVKIVVALIAIIFLAYFLASLYFSKVNGDNMRKAEAILERIGDIINNLKESEIQQPDIPNPQGWYLFSFTEDIKPNSCLGKSCICICDKILIPDNPFTGVVEKRQAFECSEGGKCIGVDKIRKFGEIEIKNPKDLTIISIKKENGEILISGK